MMMWNCTQSLQPPPRQEHSHEEEFPSVTAIIPFHKWARRDAILQAITSVVQQTYRGRVETIVVDTSNDPHAYELDSVPFARPVHVLHTNPPPGTWAGYPRNIGIRNATTEYVAFLDSDDVWFPTKLDLQFQFMKLYNQYDFVASDSVSPLRCRLIYHPNGSSTWTDWTIDELLVSPWTHAERFQKFMGKKPMTKLHHHHSPVLDGASLPAIFDSDLVEWHNVAATSSVMIRRSMLMDHQVGLFNETRNHGEDYDLWKRIMRIKGMRMGFLSRPTIALDYACHGGAGTKYGKKATD